MTALNRSLAVDGSWPMAGTRIDEIDATLLTLKGIYDRPVWSEQFRESAVACQSFAASRRTQIHHRICGAPILHQSNPSSPTWISNRSHSAQIGIPTNSGCCSMNVCAGVKTR